MDAFEVLRVVTAHGPRDDGAPVAALGDVLVVAEGEHEVVEDEAVVAEIEAPLLWLQHGFFCSALNCPDV